jgi:diguanylate cyclase (GGDEF)-like protein
MSVTLAHKVTKQDLEKEIFDLKNLLEISKSLSSTLDYSILNDSILYTCLGALAVMKAAFFSKKSIDSTDFSLHRGFLGFEIDHNREYSLAERSSLIDYLNTHFRCHTLTELVRALPKNREIEVLQAIEPSIIVPLRAKGTINGLLILGEKIDGSAFNERDMAYLLNIGSFAAIAMHNAFLFEMTTTDMMTKLKLKHVFLNSLQEKIQNWEEGRPIFSSIMLDIDHFKRLNDTYGHLAGDEVLKVVAKTLFENVRSMDLAARYGGEEFIVLLPEAGMQQAVEVAERVRQAIEANVVDFNSHHLSVTVSLGVAEFQPKRDLSSQPFIERVDQAMYRSKEAGRNRVTCSE